VSKLNDKIEDLAEKAKVAADKVARKVRYATDSADDLAARAGRKVKRVKRKIDKFVK
jgi:hypothetical protein